MTDTIKKICVINGPNLNMLGKREPEIYGSETLEHINADLLKLGHELKVDVTFFQSNHEGALIDRVHELFENSIDGVIINPGAFTHTSIALRDALSMLACPIIEIHLSNIYKREPFRHKSLVADIAVGQISGLGHKGYWLALKAMVDLIDAS